MPEYVEAPAVDLSRMRKRKRMTSSESHFGQLDLKINRLWQRRQLLICKSNAKLAELALAIGINYSSFSAIVSTLVLFLGAMDRCIIFIGFSAIFQCLGSPEPLADVLWADDCSRLPAKGHDFVMRFDDCFSASVRIGAGRPRMSPL